MCSVTGASLIGVVGSNVVQPILQIQSHTPEGMAREITPDLQPCIQQFVFPKRKVILRIS